MLSCSLKTCELKYLWHPKLPPPPVTISQTCGSDFGFVLPLCVSSSPTLFCRWFDPTSEGKRPTATVDISRFSALSSIAAGSAEEREKMDVLSEISAGAARYDSFFGDVYSERSPNDHRPKRAT